MRSFTCGFLALVAACAADPAAPTDSPATDEDYANVAASLGATAAHDGGEVAAMRHAVALAHDDHAAGFTRNPDGGFDGTMSGLQYHYAVACLDAGGEHVAPCDRTSNGAAVDAAWSGTLDLPEMTLTIAHDARWQLSRMIGAIAHVDGTGHLDYETGTFGARYRYAYDASYHVVVDDRRAIGGDIHFAITGEHIGADARRYTVAADVTFEPDDTALLVLDGTRRYQVALATGAVTPLAAGASD